MAGRTQLAPTFLDILKDSITKVAEVYWAPYNLNKKEFDIKGTITFILPPQGNVSDIRIPWEFAD